MSLPLRINTLSGNQCNIKIKYSRTFPEQQEYNEE